MLVYPQLSTGTLTQFPARKLRRMRTLINTLSDLTTVKLADLHGATTEWRLEYAGLSNEEASALQAFFSSTEGSLNTFTFLDPMANLLSWTDRLDNQVWTTGSFLTLTGGVADPIGGANGWHISNAGAGPQSITQTLSVPGDYVYCVSVYVRASQGATVTVLLASKRGDRVATGRWQRISFSALGDSGAESVAFGLEVPAGASLDIFGLQAEAQPAASAYKSAKTGGVFENAYFRDDQLSFTATGVNRHAVTVNIAHANG